MGNKFLFTADCHIKTRTWTNSALLREDSYCAFAKLISSVQNCLPNDPNYVETIVIGGDLFDSNRPTSQDLLEVNQSLVGMEAIYYIRGNHDSVDPSYLETGIVTDNLREFGPIFPLDCHKDIDMIHLSDHAVLMGIPWVPSDSQLIETLKKCIEFWRTKRSKEQDTLYLVMHCAFKHLLGFDGAYHLDIDMVKDLCGNDKINFLVGHIHTRNTTVYNAAGAYIHSPGSIYPLSTDKMSESCYGSVIDPDTGEITAINCDVRNYINVNLAEVPDGDLFKWLASQKLERCTECLPTFVNVRVPPEYKGEIPDDLRSPDYVFRIDRRLADIHRVARVAGPTYSINDAIREELQNDANRDMVIEMAEELLASDDPVGTLEEWLTFWKIRRSPC